MLFVKTSNKETYEKLLKLGFTYLHKEDNLYCFINDGKQTFDDSKDIIVTDKICM